MSAIAAFHHGLMASEGKSELDENQGNSPMISANV
jgi:hypothetical protein